MNTKQKVHYTIVLTIFYYFDSGNLFFPLLSFSHYDNLMIILDNYLLNCDIN